MVGVGAKTTQLPSFKGERQGQHRTGAMTDMAGGLETHGRGISPRWSGQERLPRGSE